MKFLPLHALSVLLVLLAAPGLRADEENLLSYSEDTEIALTGQWETYNWVTAHTGKAAGSFRAVDYAAEFERGITPRSQIALYLDAANFRVSRVPGLADRSYTAFAGARAEFKYLLRDHERESYGLALYVEPEYSTVELHSGGRIQEYSVETKLLFQRETQDERLVYVANLTLEPEFAREDGETTHETKLEFSHGLTHRVARHWYAGVENRWTGVYQGWQLHRLETHSLAAGPVLHYGGHRWWFTATWLRQLSGWPATGGGLAFDDFERNELRVKFGFNF